MVKKILPRVLVLAGDGINCDLESQYVFQKANCKTDIVHINKLLEDKNLLEQYEILVFPGGFSFGDDLGSGRVLALKIKYGLKKQLKSFIDRKGTGILGICNGFQVLIQLGLLPHPYEKQEVTLTHNTSGKFLNTWVNLEVNQNSPCIWTKNLKSNLLALPVRHAEGKIVLKESSQEEIYTKLQESGQIPLSYETDINGSFAGIAGLCDPTGRILGLMPHPEAAHNSLLYPAGRQKKITGFDLVQSGIDALTVTENIL